MASSFNCDVLAAMTRNVLPTEKCGGGTGLNWCSLKTVKKKLHRQTTKRQSEVALILISGMTIGARRTSTSVYCSVSIGLDTIWRKYC